MSAQIVAGMLLVVTGITCAVAALIRQNGGLLLLLGILALFAGAALLVDAGLVLNNAMQ